jgi:hypothetical protein
MEVNSDIERQKRQARKATMDFLRTSKERADKKGKSSLISECTYRKVQPDDCHDSSEGLTDADEEYTRFVHPFFNIMLAHIWNSIVDMGNDTEHRRKLARKAALEIIRSSKQGAKDADGIKGKKPERSHHELEPVDCTDSSDGLTKAEEEDMRFVHLSSDSVLAHLYVLISLALAASRASAAARVRNSTSETLLPEQSGSRSAIGKNKKPVHFDDDFEPSGGSLGGDVIQEPKFPVSLKVSVFILLSNAVDLNFIISPNNSNGPWIKQSCSILRLCKGIT